MSRYFILATDPLTVEEERAVKEALKPAIWWHWLPNFWLVKDSTNTLMAPAIRDRVRAVNITKRSMVIEVEHKTWAGNTKSDAQGRDMTQWLTNNWTKP